MAKLIAEHYEITKTVGNQRVKITVSITSDDEVSIVNDRSQPQFNFTRSNKDLVMAMGQALQEAAELVDSRKVTAG